MSWTPESSGGNRPWPPGSPLRGREGMPPHEWSQVVRHRGITAHVAGLFVATVRPKCDFEVPLAGITLLPLGVLRGDGEGMPAGPPTSPRDRARCGAEPHEADGAGCRQAPPGCPLPFMDIKGVSCEPTFVPTSIAMPQKNALGVQDGKGPVRFERGHACFSGC